MLTAVSILACTPTPDTTLELLVDSSDAAVVAETQRVLLKRFDDEYPGLVEAKAEGSVITVTFKHTSPDRELVRYLYGTPGRLRATVFAASLPDHGAVLFDNRAIDTVVLGVNDAGPVLNVRLTKSGGERMQRLTSRNIGLKAHISLDGRALFDAPVMGTLGDTFVIEQIDPDPAKARALATVVRSGALPAYVSERTP